MSQQTEAIKSYCNRHGCLPAAGGRVCLNCGKALEPVAVVVDPAVSDDTSDFQGDGKPLTKPSNPLNPKDAIGQGKLPMHLVPTAIGRYAALAFAEGALKYGKYNWRVAGVRISIYLDAMARHYAKLLDGEWCDGDSLGPDPVTGEPQGTQVPHLASIIACAGIILDAWEVDKLTDDRPPVNDNTSVDMDNRQGHIAHLKKLFKDYSPHQHVITDAPKQG
jgi:hypothetical protein